MFDGVRRAISYKFGMATHIARRCQLDEGLVFRGVLFLQLVRNLLPVFQRRAIESERVPVEWNRRPMY
jgi:hypothetical protein